MRRIRYLIGIISALILLISGFAPLVSHAAEATQPTISLSSNTNTVKVDDIQTVTMQTHNLPAAAVITIDLPTGLTVDQLKLAEGLDESKVQATVTATQVELKISDQTDSSISLPVVATQAGNYQLQAKLVSTDVLSNTLTLEGKVEQAGSNKSGESSIATQAKQTSQLAGPTARSVFSFNSNQGLVGGQLVYLYFYANTGLTLTGNITSSTAQTIYIGYSLYETGQTPSSDKLITTMKASGNNKNDPYSVTIPASAFPPFNDANYGKTYTFQFFMRDTPIGSATNIQRNLNFRLIYAKGSLTMTAPTTIDFGSNLDANFTTKPKYMGSIISGSPLSVVDTREFGAALPYRNGWSVTATLAKQMTGKTSGGVLTDSLHYLNDGKDTVLSNAATQVYSLKNSSKGTTNISNTWNDKNGLAFEPNVGQPQPGESYQGVVQWNLQETPSNS
ncbi:hypothetical protein LOOC260_108040 [Paucilactobacillus hokkaidonensis JCM 18461]|uniref:WxL domain-containing protein n=2 Tax=Paucilactobacillus hokkaidonensis TaxID=1193095 RepID=A0A0A1GWB2_9LACO|nr:hypothetical protein [Paucilactobacillus hokkaidonensis]KRO10143.1 putative cell surface protein (putative) [Paucilactobacillus hokkaidonensis]BAP85344.1 hypothetical protein LOOC260_108040 [Paucilactobacillus hokkaidonensis JCM 18461]